MNPLLTFSAVVVLGVLQVFGTIINGFVGRRLGVLKGTFVFLAIGAILSAFIIYLFEGLELTQFRELPLYLYIPGLINLFFIVGMIRVVNVIGAMLMTACLFIGKMLISVVLDHIGFLGLPTIPASSERLLALGTLLCGVILLSASKQQLSPDFRFPSTLRILAILMALCLGMLVGLASAFNAVLGQNVGTFTTTLMFLGPGAVFLWLWLLVTQVGGEIKHITAFFKPLYFLPGTINVAGIAGSIVLVPIVGLQIYMATTLTAGVITSMMVDRVGLFGMPVSPITIKRILAALLLGTGVYLSFL